MHARTDTSPLGAAAPEWDHVAAGAGAMAVMLLWSVAAIARDIEAFAIAILLFASVLMVRYPRRRWARTLGRVAAVVLFLDVTAWMAPAVVSNTTAGEAIGDVMTPLALTALSATGLLASAVRLIRVRATRRGVGALIAIVALAGSFAGALSVFARGGGVVAQAGDAVISARNVEFSTDDLNAVAGTLAVVVTNHDLFWHTFTIEKLDVDVRVPTGGTRRAVFDAPRGVYEYMCAIPGHETRMRGTLTVS
ncbi:MAG TPA: cupredoxin domain-containing protein [Acidimicrobiales bacterium]|nr:cupredoxin domain-containing protein [Acidimicrobiales bacterium]